MPTELTAVTRLSEQEQKRLAAKYPEIRDGELTVFISGSYSMLSAVEAVVESMAWRRDQEGRLLDALAGFAGKGVPDQPRVLQLRRQAEARMDFLGSVEMLTSAEIAQLSQSTARNTSALASRWKAEGKIFAVDAERPDRFPAFQFGDDGKPLPAVAEVIRAFEGQSRWALALWFVAPSGWLDGASPAAMLPTDPSAVVEAARRATEPLAV